MSEHLIHNFSKKILQKSILPHLVDYVRCRAAKRDLSNLAPISINLDLITACNYRCDHCIDKWYYDGKQLDFDYLTKLISDWSKNGLRSVIIIGGGEPTLYPYFEEVVKLLKDCSLQVGLVSNGSKIKRIVKIANLLTKGDWVRLSLDSGTNETFKKIHHPKDNVTLDGILAGVREIHKINPELQIGYSFLVIGEDKYVKGIPLTSNIKEIALAARRAKENGFSYFSLKPFINPEATRKTQVSEKNLREIKKEIKEAKRLENKNLRVVESTNLLYFFDNNLKKTMDIQPKICHAQFFRLVVSPAGIFHCALWRGFNNTKIIDTNREITEEYYKEFHEKRMKMLDHFNAKKVCRDVVCLYSPFNYWIDRLINSPEKLKEIKPIDNFGDYFF